MKKQHRIAVRFTKEAWARLLQMVYLGNYVINGCRRVGEERAAYGSLADALYLREAARTYAREDIEPNEIADVRDRVADAAERFLCAFEASLA